MPLKRSVTRWLCSSVALYFVAAILCKYTPILFSPLIMVQSYYICTAQIKGSLYQCFDYSNKGEVQAPFSFPSFKLHSSTNNFPEVAAQAFCSVILFSRYSCYSFHLIQCGTYIVLLFYFQSLCAVYICNSGRLTIHRTKKNLFEKSNVESGRLTIHKISLKNQTWKPVPVLIETLPILRSHRKSFITFPKKCQADCKR